MTIVTIQLSPIDLYFVGKHHWKKNQPLQWRYFTWDIRYKLFPFVNPQISPDFFL